MTDATDRLPQVMTGHIKTAAYAGECRLCPPPLFLIFAIHRSTATTSSMADDDLVLPTSEDKAQGPAVSTPETPGSFSSRFEAWR